METIKISKAQFTCEQDVIDKEKKLSKANPDKYVTCRGAWDEIHFYIHNRKPTINSAGAEDSYRSLGGFLKNGKVVKPSPTFIKKFNHCPVSH